MASSSRIARPIFASGLSGKRERNSRQKGRTIVSVPQIGTANENDWSIAMSVNGFPLVRDQDSHFTSGPLRTVKISVVDQHDRCETAFEGIVGQSSALCRVLPVVENVDTR